ncbi:MAG: hypothetical protein V4773_10800, partial [Verrucomicrobiota bacterium]
MKSSAVLGLATLLALGTFGTGCSLTRQSSPPSAYQPTRRAKTFALAVTVQGGLQPTPAQWAAIQAKMSADLAARGMILVTDVALADAVIRIDFRPNPLDPEGAGHISVLGIRRNPYAGIASTAFNGPYSSGYANSYSNGFMNPYRWGSANYFSGDYYTYSGPWENGYTSGWTPRPSTPPPAPHRPHPPGTGGNREHCPPDALYSRPTSLTTYASNGSGSTSSLPTVAVYNSPATPSSSGGRWTGERSAWGRSE